MLQSPPVSYPRPPRWPLPEASAGRRALSTVLAVTVVVCAWSGAGAQQTEQMERPEQPAKSIESFAPSDPAAHLEAMEITRASLEKWVETRKLISQEKRDWALGQGMLRDRIDLYQREIEAMRSRVRDAERSMTETDKARATLEEQHEKAKEASAALAQSIKDLEARTKALLPRLPDPIRERIKPLSQRLPDDPDTTELGLSSRVQNIVGILNEVNKFNREITVASEVRSLPSGVSMEVTTLYLGIGQGYYVDAAGTAAGIGTATATGWQWFPADHAAPQIAQVIAMFRNELGAAFVTVPFDVQQPQEQNR